MLNSNFPMVGGLAMQGASVRPQQLATGGLTYNAPGAGFDPYTYGQGTNGGWLFWKPPAPAVTPTPDPTQITGGLGGGPDAWQGLSGTASLSPETNWWGGGGGGRDGSSPTGGFGGTGGTGGIGPGASTGGTGPGTDDSGTHGDHTSNPGGFSSKGLGEGLADFGKNALGFTAPISAVVSTLNALAQPTQARISRTGIIDAILGNDPDPEGGIGGFGTIGPGAFDPGVMGVPGGVTGRGQEGHGTGSNNSSSDPNGNGSTGTGTGGHGEGNGGHHARGGLIASHGVRHPYAHGGLARSGLIQGPGGGQDDRVPMTVPADSYVIPADVVAGLGDGNPEEGAKRLHRAVGGRAPAMGGLSRPGVPVAVSPAEQVIPPDRVAALGGGSIDRGERALDGFVRNVRKHKTSKGGKHPPKARPANSYMPRGKR